MSKLPGHTLIGCVSLAGILAASACSSSDSGATTGATTGTSTGGTTGQATVTTGGASGTTTSGTSTSGTTSGASTGTATTGATTGGTTGGSDITPVNGCTAANVEDHTADTALTITFGSDYKFHPACAKIKAGTTVTFMGDFSFHPLAGGDAGTLGTPDTSSPITVTTTGMSKSFTLTSPGAVPYFCEFHFSLGMMGALYVVP